MSTTANSSTDPQPLDFLQVTPQMLEYGDDAFRRACAEKTLGDRRWRLGNLYWIKPEGGGDPIRFIPRDYQWKIYDHLLTTPDKPVFIIKSRRLGFSTALSVFSGDQVAFSSGQNINLVDLTQPDAHKKMREQIRYAVDSLPRPILDRMHFGARNESQLAMAVKGQPESALSNIFAGMNARGGDTSGLWISEWGPLAAQDPYRSGKILSGAFPAARKGWRCTETTWMGGKNGDLWNLIQPIYEGNPNADGVIYFFPWHGDPSCVSLTGDIASDDIRDYFRELESELGKKFSDEQKKWWAVEKTRLGIKMAQEFPSTIEEAFSAPGNAPLFSERGLNWIQKHLADHKTQYGLITIKSERPVWERLPDNDDSAWLRIWEHPIPGCQYLMPGDYCTAEDVENPDYHAVGIIRAPYQAPDGLLVPAAVVAAIKTDRRTNLDILAQQQYAMQLYYGDSTIVPEINNLHGYVDLLRNAGCRNIYQRILYPDAAGDKRTRKETGWKTTRETKPLICETLAAAIREEQLLVFCPRILSELRAFQIDLKALTGHHDDWVMMLAIGVHTLPHAHTYAPRTHTASRPVTDHHPDYADPSAPAATDHAHLFYSPQDSVF